VLGLQKFLLAPIPAELPWFFSDEALLPPSSCPASSQCPPSPYKGRVFRFTALPCPLMRSQGEQGGGGVRPGDQCLAGLSGDLRKGCQVGPRLLRVDKIPGQG